MRTYEDGYQQAKNDILAILQSHLDSADCCRDISREEEDMMRFNFWDGYWTCADSITDEINEL